MLFITERDTLYPPEEEEPPAEEGEDGKKKKKPKKKEEEEIKTYLNHKYKFPECGRDKRHLDNIAANANSDYFTLSCFSR